MEQEITNRMLSAENYIVKDVKTIKEKRKGIFIALNPELHDKFKAIAKEQNININATLTKFIQDLVNSSATDKQENNG